MKPSIAILGPGAVGGALASVLWKADFPVTCIARESTADLISREGIRYDNPTSGNFIAHPRASAQLDIKPDLIFITTKATSIKEALIRVPPELTTYSTIIPLLNGLEHMEKLRKQYGKNVLAASIRIESKYLGPNHVVQTSSFFRIEIASDGDIPMQHLQQVVVWLGLAGVEVEIMKSEAQVLWGKLARLNALACTTSASNQSIGFIRSNPWWRRQLEECILEGIAVAKMYGATIDFKKTMEIVEGLSPSLSTSMHRDILAGRPNELDAIAGAVVRAGARQSLPCPTIENMIVRIRNRTGQS